MAIGLFNDFSPRLTDLKKFYFLEYFYILIEGVSNHKEKHKVFEHFKSEKESKNLGESRYKKIHFTVSAPSEKQLSRYKYTFNQVLEECLQLDLIELNNSELTLKEKGENILKLYQQKEIESCNLLIFKWIEEKTFGFNHIIKSLYAKSKSGLVVFPIYSPLKLHFTKQEIIEKNRLVDYLNKLKSRIESDISNSIGKKFNLVNYNLQLLNNLKNEGIVDFDYNIIDSNRYNYLIKFIRDFWHSILLKDFYDLKIKSLSYLDLWVYRAKQLGLVNVAEYYMGISGKIVYPISILRPGGEKKDFDIYYEYEDGNNIYVHNPKWQNFKESFIQMLFECYLEIRQSSRTNFANLLDIRDLVCLRAKISFKKFEDFLNQSYQTNLEGNLRLDISLESDRVPEEQKATYLKREPINIGGKQRNIIAIEIKK